MYDIVVPEVLWKIPNDAGSWWHDKGFCLTVDVEVVQVFDRSKVMWSPQQGGYQYQWRGYGGQYDNQDHGHGGALITNSTMMVPERGQPQPQYRDEGFFRETTEFYREWRSMLWDRLNSRIDDRRVSSTSIDYILKTLVFTAARPIPIPSQQGDSAGSCAICLEELFADDDDDGGTQEEVLGLRPCSHMFHASCIRKWLERKTSCPMCREELGDQLLDPPKSDPPGWALAGY